jgi:hypothetical protein
LVKDLLPKHPLGIANRPRPAELGLHQRADQIGSVLTERARGRLPLELATAGGEMQEECEATPEAPPSPRIGVAVSVRSSASDRRTLCLGSRNTCSGIGLHHQRERPRPEYSTMSPALSTASRPS